MAIDVTLRPNSADELRAVFARLRDAGRELARRPLDQLLEPLGKLAESWRPGSANFEQACEMLTGVFSRRAVAAALEGLVGGLNPMVLRAELARELGRVNLLDAWQADELGVGHVRGYPLGVVAQVLAGNVFLGGVVAIAQSLLTRNAVVLKLSREDSGFTALFAQTLGEIDAALGAAVAVCAWDSSREELNEVVRTEADAVVVWGGAAAVAAYPAERCRGRVIHYGPRLGVGLVLGGIDLELALPALAWDVALWEQRACSSPRLVMVEDIDDLPRRVAAGLDRAMADIRTTFPVRPLTLDEKAEVLSVRELAWWSGTGEAVGRRESMGHTILLARESPGEIPIGFRTVLVVPVPSLDDLPRLLAPYREALQTAVLAAPPARWPAAVDVLVRAGLTLVAAAGASSARVLGLPHEGEFALGRLVKLVGVDLGYGPLAFPGRNTAPIAAELS